MLFTLVEFVLESVIWVTGKTLALGYRAIMPAEETAEQKLDRVLGELEQVKEELARLKAAEQGT